MQGMNQDLLDEIDAKPQYSLVHVRIQARTARKSLTLIEGMPQDIDLKKVLRYFKKAFQCNGTIVYKEETGEIIQLTGDNRREVLKFLKEECIVPEEYIRVYGN